VHVHVDESRLDDADALAAADPSAMLRAVASSGAQVRQAAAAAAEARVAVLAADGRPRAVVVTGMGGSGIAGDVLAAVAGTGSPAPVLTHRGYQLPGWVGPMDLVVAVSFSGATEETLSCADEAARRGCRMLVVAAAGSPLEELAERGHGVFVPVEQGGRQPRASLWGLSVPLLVAADALGLADCPAPALDGAADLLDELASRYGPAVPLFENPAKALATQLVGAVPMVWGSGEMAGTGAYRLACQLAENAKYAAAWGVLPEAGHNQVVALDGPFASAAADEDDFFRDRVDDPFGSPRLRVLLLRDDAGEQEQLRRRREATVRLAGDRGVPVSELVAEGDHPVSRLASLVGAADFTSVYLALVLGVDPTPVDSIAYVKEQLSA
jgi:glucose/mannose-6-phosphate isomerase